MGNFLKGAPRPRTGATENIASVACDASQAWCSTRNIVLKVSEDVKYRDKAKNQIFLHGM